MSILAELRKSPWVSRVSERSRKNLVYAIIFKEPLYDEQIDRICLPYSDDFQIISRNRNKSMARIIWVDISTKT